MLPILQIGPLALPAPTLLLMIGLLVGLEMAERQAARFGVQADDIYTVTLTAVIAGLVGARLTYAALNLPAFVEYPLNLLAPRPQMFNAAGGLGFALAAALVSVWRRRLGLWVTADAATGLLAVMAVALGLAHLASGDAFGAPARLPWAVYLWGELRHPSQVYETLAAVAIGAVVWPWRWLAAQSGARPGLRFWLFAGLSAAARLALETFRGDSVILWNTFRAAQLVAWLALAICLWQIGRRIAVKVEETEPVSPGNE